MSEFLSALFLIFMAEMGDKTQILAMTFSMKYNIKKVIIGIFIGSLLNHGLAVFFGGLLSKFIDLNKLTIVAGLMFLFFSIWSLKYEDQEDEEEQKFKFGPVLTVALAFFIGELGDKTQLSAITLAMDSKNLIITLMGTVSGMVLTSLIGIFIGVKLGDKISGLYMKIVSSIIFLGFSISKLKDIYLNIFNSYMIMIIALTIILLIVYYKGISKLLYLQSLNTNTLYKKKLKEIYEYFHEVKVCANELCLNAKVCQKNKCVLYYILKLLENLDENGLKLSSVDKSYDLESLKKDFDEEKLKNLIEKLDEFENSEVKELEELKREREILDEIKKVAITILNQKKN